MRTFQHNSLIIALCIISVCSCTSPIFKGSNGIVRYQEFEYNNDEPYFELVLVQETNKDYENILAAKKEWSHIKKAPIDEYDYLIETLVDECDYLDLIESATPWEIKHWKRMKSPRVISIENEYGIWVLPSMYCMGECIGDQQSFTFAKFVDVVRSSFDNTYALQVIDNEDKSGEQFFKEEQERLDRLTNKRNLPIKASNNQ